VSTPIDPASVELGLDTFGDVTTRADGTLEHHAVVLRQVVEQAELADRVGLAFIGLGEHHRDDFAITAPDVVLAAIAARTERIRLGSAVTVLSSDDPIRVFERFSTLDALSNGRAEVIIGRGSFTESFGLFGFDLADYERLFTEKLDLLSHVLTEEPVTWSGSIRPPLREQRIFPPTESGRLKVWIGVGGTPQSVVRAAHYRLPLMLAIIGGPPAQFVPFANYYRERRAAHRPAGERGRGATSRPATSCSRTSRRSATASAASAAGRPPRASSSSATPAPRAPSTSARPRRSRARSPRTCARWASAAST